MEAVKMITCFFMRVQPTARAILGGWLTGTRQMVPVWIFSRWESSLLGTPACDQCCHRTSLTLPTELRERCVTGNMSIYWIFSPVREAPCGCGVSECGLGQVIRLSLLPPLENVMGGVSAENAQRYWVWRFLQPHFLPSQLQTRVPLV